MFAAAASVMTAAISPGWAANAARTASMSLYGSTITSAVVAAGDAGRVGQRERGDPGTGRGQQRVDMAVVAPGELDDLGPAGEPAGQPDRRHGGLGARGDQPHLLDRSRLWRRSPRPAATSPAPGVPNDSPRPTAAGTASSTAGCAWPRIIGPHEPTRSTYSLAVGIGDPGPVAGHHEPGGAADRAEGPDRRVHPARGDRAGPGRTAPRWPVPRRRPSTGVIGHRSPVLRPGQLPASSTAQ